MRNLTALALALSMAVAGLIFIVDTPAFAEESNEASNDGTEKQSKIRDRLPKMTNDCIFFRTIYDWKAIDHYSLIVWFNNRHHAVHVELDTRCSSLPFEHTIAFTDNMDGRLCAFGGDSIIVGGPLNQRCTIGAITPYDLEEDKLGVTSAGRKRKKAEEKEKSES